MRWTTPQSVTLSSQNAHSLTFTGGRGETLRVTVLDHDLIRVEHHPDGQPRLDRTWWVAGDGGDTPREGRSRADLSPFPLPPFALDQTDAHTLTLATDRLRLDIRTGAFALRWTDAAGRELAADVPGRAYSYDRAGRAVCHYLRRGSRDHYYGFGEKAGPLDKRGRRLRMSNTDALGYNAETSDPLYKHIPFYLTFIPDVGAYGLFYDNPADSVFDLGQEISAIWGDYRVYQADDGDLDLYFIHGPTLAEVVRKFARLTGLPALPPRWSLGYLGSTMFYTEQPDAQAQLEGFIAQCQQHDIPCDGFHLSSGYTTDAQGRRYVFTWNRAKVPDAAGLAAAFNQAGIRLAANIKPHLLADHPRYAEVAALGGFIQDAETDEPYAAAGWAGGMYENARAAFLDFSSAAGYDWWKARCKDALLDFGIIGLWNDNNEFEIADGAARCAGFGQPLPASLARPLQTLLMGRASYEAALEHRPDHRPYVISRAGGPGIQRYAQTWSGDNTSSWHTLRWNLPMGLGLSLSGIPNTGHDVGGFFGTPPDPELLIRWIQAGLLHPRFTLHSIGFEIATEPWMYPEHLPLVRDLFRLRYRLIPYLYTLLFRSAQTGDPVIRPLVYAYPDDPRTHTESFDFLLGPNLLAAPVLQAGARSRPVYLPGDGLWCDFHTGVWFSGGQTVNAAAPLERLPWFVPAGGIIPMGRPLSPIGVQPDDFREAWVFPHPESGRGQFSLIEDDGETLAYRQGAFSEVLLAVEATADGLTLTARQHGAFPLPYRHIEFVLPPGEARPILSPQDGIWSDGLRRHVRVAVVSD